MAKGKVRRGFDLDLAEAEFREGVLARLLGGKVELKTDYEALRTGNVFLEFADHGRPSGIRTTEAAWWCFELPGRAHVILPTERVKVLGRKAWKDGKRVRGGDEDQYEGVLIPVEWLVKQ